MTAPLTVLECCRLTPEQGTSEAISGQEGTISLCLQVPTHPTVLDSIRGRKLPPFSHGLNARSSAGNLNVGSPFTVYPEEVAALFSLTEMSWQPGSRVKARK